MKHIKPFIFESNGGRNLFPTKLANFLLDESSHILSIIDDIGIISKDEFYARELFLQESSGVYCEVSEIFISGKSLTSNSEILKGLEKPENFDCVQTLLGMLYDGSGMVTINVYPFDGDSITEEDYRLFSNNISRSYKEAKVSKNLVSEGGGRNFIGHITIKIDYKSLLR